MIGQPITARLDPLTSPLRVAIYARKSTDQNGVGEEEKSVTRQTERARPRHARG